MAVIPSRQIILDTETTGMNLGQGNHFEGHKIVEIGAVEMINRRLTGKSFHAYIQPDREVDPEAYAVHGISNEFLADKPRFTDIAADFMQFIEQAELIIHNAPFDVGFIDYEYRLMASDFKVAEHCTVTDSLVLARRLFPGKRNSLDALCERYGIDNSHRTRHGALLDAEILADVYLTMTGGQTSLRFLNEENIQLIEQQEPQFLTRSTCALPIIFANETEQAAHQTLLEIIAKKSGKTINWQ